MIIRKIKVTEFEYQPPINYVAGATEPDIQFELVDFTIPEEAVARAYVKRFDGSFEYTAAVISGNTITIAPTTSMFSVKGEGAIQVTITVGDEVIKNFSVPVYVHADLADDTAQEGRDVVSVFQEAEQAAAQQFQEDAEQIAEEVKESIPADYTALTEEVGQINERLTIIEDRGVESGLTEDVKQALLMLAEKIVYIDANGQTYYDALEDALHPKELLYITASFDQEESVIYDTYTLNTLKPYLTVRAIYGDGSRIVSNYTLSGDLEVGSSIITVSYMNKSATFTVNVSSRLPAEYRQVEYVASNGTQGITTDIIPRDTRTLITYEFIDFISGHDNFVCGVWNDGNQRYYAVCVISSGVFRFVNRSNSTKWTGPTKPLGKHTVDYNNASHQVIYDDVVRATDATFALTGGDGKIGLFTRDGNIGYSSIVKIYSAMFEDNTSGNVVGNFIPCYRKSDGVIGLYDLVTEQFYTDKFDGDSFTKGANSWEEPS